MNDPTLNITILAAGGAGMICGSCLRDSSLARTLRTMGHEVMLVPLYTPLRTENGNIAADQVFYGGLNSWLQYASSLFRHTPRALDWLLDRPWLLNLAGRMGAQTSPAKLGPFTLSILRGESGPQIKELRRLVDFLKQQNHPGIVSIPNTMFMGAARMIRAQTGAKIICELTGEDIFLDALAEPYRTQARDLQRQRITDIDRFIATSNSYAKKMAEYLDIPIERIDVVYPGVSREMLLENDPPASSNRPPTVGYLARICPEKGLDRLIDAMAILKRTPGMTDVRLRAAGYLGAKDRPWFEKLLARIQREDLQNSFEYAGEVDFAGKLALLDSVDVFSVPTTYEESKGIYILEAMARGLPVVQPAHGSFPELLELTGGGTLAPPGDAMALATGLAELLRNPARRSELGRAGRQSISTKFLDEHMAANMLRIYQEMLQ